MKHYLIPTIITETEFEELKKKAEDGDAAAQLQVAFAYEPTLRTYAEELYGEQFRFWTKEEDRLNRQKGRRQAQQTERIGLFVEGEK